MMEYKLFVPRYTHDAVTQEFVNVGVLLYSEAEHVLKAKFTTQGRRLSGMFGAVDGDSFRSAIRYMQGQLDALAADLHQTSLRSTMFSDGDLRAILAQVLPEDASALQFHLIGGGLSRTSTRRCSLFTIGTWPAIQIVLSPKAAPTQKLSERRCLESLPNRPRQSQNNLRAEAQNHHGPRLRI
jgi:Protein of unknown function (DUF3037)